MRKRKWTEKQLREAVKNSTSRRQVLYKLGRFQAGSNYPQLKKYLREFNLDTSHFTGTCWNKGKKYRRKPDISLDQILVKDSFFQSYKLKKRLFEMKIKIPICEECGWARKSEDGRLTLELDHINGDRNDNRLNNLRILCPNCHSLKPTHRGRNKKRVSGGIGIRAPLKMVSFTG